MLREIEIFNVNSIVEAKFEFKKGKYDYSSNMVFENDVVSPIAIYGFNGTGKSSLINAMFQLNELLIGDINHISPLLFNFVHMNRMFKEKREYPDSRISLTFSLPNKNDKIYNFSISTNPIHDGITREVLTVTNGNRKGIIYDRDLKSITINNQIIEIEKSLYLALRNLANNSDIKMSEAEYEELLSVYQFLSNIAVVNFQNKISSRITNQKKELDLLLENSEGVFSLISEYNHFPKYHIVKIENTPPEFNNKSIYNILINSSTSDGQDNEIELPIELMSSGMRMQSRYLSLILSMPKNSILFIDEVERNLHPFVIESFIHVCNKKKIQLIFTSHNTNILQYLRPDQIFFAKWNNGESKYNKLSSSFPNIRQVNNIEKMYLSGYFEEE